MKSQQSGFTLIELIMIIVILGVLAVTAIPKYIDLQTEAKAAALQGVAGALTAASAINYAGCSVVGNVVTADKCVQVLNCSAVSGLLAAGLPAGYTNADLAADETASGVTHACSLVQTDGGATLAWNTISAGI